MYFCSPVALLEFVPSFLFICSLWLEFTLPSTHHLPWESFSFCFWPFNTPLGVPAAHLLLLSHHLSKLVSLLVDLSPLLWRETLGFSSQGPQCLSVCSLNVTCWTRDSHMQQIYNVPSVAFLRNRFQNNINLKLCEYKNNIENLLIVFYGSKWKIYA